MAVWRFLGWFGWVVKGVWGVCIALVKGKERQVFGDMDVRTRPDLR